MNLLRGMLAGLGALAALSGGAIAQDAYPSKPIEITAPYEAGGATDRMIRHLAPYLAKELGQPVNVVNRPGGGTLTGTVFFFNQPADGYNLLFIPPTPYFMNHIEVMKAPYTLDDFAFVNAQEVAQSLLVVPKDSPLNSLDDIIAGLKEPGKLSAGVILGSSEHISILLMMQKLGIPAENLRLVTYEGGGPTRTAIVGAQVDFGMVPGQGSEVIFPDVKKIALVAAEKNPDWPEATPINEALKPYNIELPYLDSSARTMIAHAKFATEHPDRYKIFLDAYKRVIDNPEYQAAAKAGNYGANWLGPEASNELVHRNYKLLVEYSSLLD